MPDLFDFTPAGLVSITRDYGLEQMQGAIDFFQAVYVDNSLNASAVTFTFSGMQYKIVVKPNTQGIYPVLVNVGGMGVTVTATNGVKVPVIFFNVQQPYLNWLTA